MGIHKFLPIPIPIDYFWHHVMKSHRIHWKTRSGVFFVVWARLEWTGHSQNVESTFFLLLMNCVNWNWTDFARTVNFCFKLWLLLYCFPYEYGWKSSFLNFKTLLFDVAFVFGIYQVTLDYYHCWAAAAGEPYIIQSTFKYWITPF